MIDVAAELPETLEEKQVKFSRSQGEMQSAEVPAFLARFTSRR